MKKAAAYHFIYRVTLIAVLIFFSQLSLAQANKKNIPGGKLPNIIYIYADDLGYGELGCYGQQKIKTPNIDRMAQEGMRFTQHYAGSPVCAPSRAMLMTGKHSGHSYIRGNYELGGFKDEEEGGQMPLPEGIFTLPKMLKQAGYKTGMCGKWGLGMAGTTGAPSMQGFDYYYSVLDQKQAHNFYPTHLWENGRWDTLNNHVINVHQPLNPTQATDADFDYYKGKDYAITKMTEKALDFIDRYKQQPFFLYLSYTLPHLSLQVPDEYIKKFIGLFDEEPYYGQSGYAATKYPMSTYAAMITYLDDQVGIIVQKIKELGLDSNTIIMFSSDNGATFHSSVDTKFFNSVNGLRGLKMEVYEGGIRVPFIARWPGKIKPGKISDHISAQYDLMATLMELTGQVINYKSDGISFLPELLGNSNRQKKHEYLYFEYPENGGQVAIRMGDWKGVRTNVKKEPTASWQLYSLSADRNETTDLAPTHPGLVKRMEMIQQKEHQCAHIREWEFIDPKFSMKN
jgi:arylsulfatase A-like enzyme